MPIKRLQRDASFPCIGKLRKGGEKTGNRPGKDLEYFRFDADADAMARFRSAYGDEPDTINVFLPHVHTDENFSAWQEAWVAGGLQHRCDGETCVIWLDSDGKYKQTPKPCPGGCKEVGRLMVIIPELQRFAYVTVETHSVHDIIALDEQLRAVESLRGSLQGIPFILKRRPKEISTPGSDGKRVRREKWLLSIEVDPVWASLQIDAMHQRALAAPSVVSEDRMLTVALEPDMDSDANPMGDLWADVPELDPGDTKPSAEWTEAASNGTQPAQTASDGDGDAPAQAMKANTRKKLHAVGTQVYGDGWEAERHRVIKAAGLESSNDLTEEQANKWIAKMNATADEQKPRFEPAGPGEEDAQSIY